VRIVDHGSSEAPRRRGLGIGWLVAVLVIAGAVVWSLNYHVDEYAITPGLAQPVGPLITVTGHSHAPDRRAIYLTDVYVTQLTFWQWVAAEIHPVHEQIVSGSYFTGNQIPISQLQDQSYLMMVDSKNAARAVAMRSLGYRVVGLPAGATVTAVAIHAPASSLSVGDRIVAARGHPVADECALFAALRGAVPGQPVALRVARAHFSVSGTLTYAAPTTVEVDTGAIAPSARATGCPNAPTRSVYFGVALEDATAWRFPIDVAIDTAFIGGPSAGLAMTLGTMDALSRVPITGQMKIAATGTISPNGIVGDVGGVAEKTIAVENAGAKVFLVPVQEEGVARSAASPGLKVVAVRTLAQAMREIEALGGHAPVPFPDTATRVATS
jgi:PDZ domain-containing protein